MVDEEKLQKYLRKCELQYRADNETDGLVELDWLAPHCNTLDDITSFLRSLGFRIRYIVDYVDGYGNKIQSVTTTSGVIVFVNAHGLRGLFGVGGVN